MTPELGLLNVNTLTESIKNMNKVKSWLIHFAGPGEERMDAELCLQNLKMLDDIEFDLNELLENIEAGNFCFDGDKTE